MSDTSRAINETPSLRLARALRQHQATLKEVLDALEKRDMTPSQIREHLGWVAEGLKGLRKELKDS